MSTEHHHQQPDELYTLRTQYLLGHYNAALSEAKQMSRRPISSTALKVEREEYIYRCYIALQQYDKCIATDTSSPGLQALVLKAQYEAAIGNDEQQMGVYNQMKALASSHPSVTSVQYYTAQVACMANEISYAYQLLCSSNSTNSNGECITLKIQIYIKIDRIDLAQKELVTLQKYVGEDNVLVELCTIYIAFAVGKSMASDAEHRLTSLSEQYGPSIYLLNLLSIAQMIQGNVIGAETTLMECYRDYQTEMTSTQKAETLCNLCTIYHQQPLTKGIEANNTIQELLSLQSSSPSITSTNFTNNYQRVTTAFDREAVRYEKK